MKQLSLAVLMVTVGFQAVFADALTPQQIEKTKRVTSGYELAKKSIQAFLDQKLDEMDGRFYDKLRGCDIAIGEDGGSSIGGDSRCGVYYLTTHQQVRRGYDENGKPVIDELFEEELEIRDSALAELTGLRSWKSTSVERVEALPSTPADVFIRNSNTRLLTVGAEEVGFEVHGRTYVNTETTEHTVVRNLNFSFEKEFITTVSLKVEVFPRQPPKSVKAKWDSQAATLGTLLSIFTGTVLNYTFASE